MTSGLKINLDDIPALTSFDKSSCHSSIQMLPKQLSTAWNLGKNVDLSKFSEEFDAVYFCGMGGSVYAGRIIKYLYRDSLKIPLEIIDNYHIPKSATNKSLIICASYSGNTEETLSCLDEAISQKYQVIGITTGGKIKEKLEGLGMPCFVFKPNLNPSSQPRLGQGYMIAGALSILTRLKVIDIRDEEITNLEVFLAGKDKLLNWESPMLKNQAKGLSQSFESKQLFFVASDFLEGAVHAIRNPINETGKHFASYFIIPEINHHLLEGLSFPESLKSSAVFCFINSEQYPDKIKKRFTLTEEVIKKNGIQTRNINLDGGSKLFDTFELILHRCHGLIISKNSWNETPINKYH